MKNFILISFLVIGFISCKTTPQGRKETSKHPKSLIINSSIPYATELHKVRILNTKITDDILQIKIEYSGGCEKHDFNLIFNEIWKKSMPPKITLFLEHKDGNDKCKALVSEVLKFDIKNLKEKTNEVYINLVGYSKSIKY